MTCYLRTCLILILLHTSALWCMTNSLQELSWGHMPSDITQEICTALVKQPVYAAAAAEHIRSFLAVNKQLRSYQSNLSKHLLPQLCASTRLHPFLAHACLMTKADWITSRNHEIETAEYINIKTENNRRLVDSQQMCNKVEATLAGLINHAHKMALLCPSSRYKALHSYLNTKYHAWNDAAAVIIREDGTPLVVAPHVLKRHTCYAINNAPWTIRYNRNQLMHEISGFMNSLIGDVRIRQWGTSADYKLKDIYFCGHHMLLFAPDSGERSFIVSCTDPRAIYDTLRYWTSRNKKENFLYAPVEKTTVSFEGIATNLAYDDATQTIKAFDKHGAVLYSEQI